MFGLSGAGFIGLKLAGIEARHQYEKTKDRKHVLFFPPSIVKHLFCSSFFNVSFVLASFFVMLYSSCAR